MEQVSIIVIAALVLAFLCWKEYTRKNKAHLALRITASLLAVLALYFIARPIRYQRPVDPGLENTAVLLTKGYPVDSLAGLKNIPRFSSLPFIVADHKNVTFVPDIGYFFSSNADISTIHILGEGLETAELQALQSRDLVFHPADISGLSSVHWQHTIRSGEQLIVQGNYRNNGKPVKLLLRGLNTTLDSINIPAKQTQHFALSTRPKILGEALFFLLAVAGTDTLAIEKLPFVVKTKQPLKILTLASSPDFESKFLKNWLFSEKHKLAIRSRISKDKYGTEFLNMNTVGLNRIAPALLQGFDILISDLTELSRLSSSESAALQDQISKGLGLYIRADEVGGTSFYHRAFRIRQSQSMTQNNLSLIWNGHKAITIPALASNLEILPSPGEQVLVRDSKNRALVSSKLFGAGRILAGTVPDTYTWMLSNKTADYSSYWSYLLDKAARKTELKESWSQAGFPSVNEPTELQLEASTDSLPRAVVQHSILHFSQHAAMPFSWASEYWPSKTGWQSISSNKREQSWYVFDEGDWQSVKAAQKVKNTRWFIDNNKTALLQTRSAARQYPYTVPALYFFILFVVCCAYLWIEGKLA